MKGKLPKEFIKANEDYRIAVAKDLKAYNDYNNRWMYDGKGGYRNKTAFCDERILARECVDKFWEIRTNKLQYLREMYIKYLNEIEELHKKECPNCPWDGTTIFPVSATR